MSWEIKLTRIKLGQPPRPTIVMYPSSLNAVMEAIAEKVGRYDEFAAYVPFKKEKINVDGAEIDVIKIPEDYVVKVPPQRVSPASVDVEDAPVGMAAIHKHPDGMRSFSETDYESINANNDVSLLWVDGDFAVATLRYIISGYVIIAKTKALAPYPDDFAAAMARNKDAIESASENVKRYAVTERPVPVYEYPAVPTYPGLYGPAVNVVIADEPEDTGILGFVKRRKKGKGRRKRSKG